MIQVIIQPLYYLHRLEVPPWRIRVHSDTGGDKPCRKTSKTGRLR